MIPIAGGEVLGPRIRGKVLPGGADFQLMRVDGVTDLQARYVIEIEERQLIYVENSGVRYGPPELMEKLRRGETVDSALIYFRTTPRFETAARDMNGSCEICSCVQARASPDRVEMRFYPGDVTTNPAAGSPSPIPA